MKKQGETRRWFSRSSALYRLNVNTSNFKTQGVLLNKYYWHVDENGNKIEEIADKETGSNLAGLTETFYAKGGNELNEGYREGYFPTTTSTSITLDINQETMYVEFHYIQHDPVPYTVKYLLNNSDGTTTELFSSVTYNDNKKAVVVENAKMKSGYKVDEPQKSLIIDIAEGATNEIIFYYEVDANASFYDVTHKIKKYNSNEWEEYRFNQYNAQVNGNASSNPLTIPGYTYMETASDGSKSVTNGTVTVDGLHLVFYYEEDKITIDYKPVNSNDVIDNTSSGTISATTETTGALNGTIDGSTATAKPGYEFTGWYSDADCTQKVSSDAKFVPERNSDGLYESATYYAKFEETRVTIIYVVDGGVGGTVSPGAEALGAATGTAKGSTATNDPGYKFIGWYDSNNNELSTELTYVPKKVNGLNVAATYIAKFEQTNTTINYKIVDPDGNVYDANQACGALSSFGETVLTATGTAIGSTATNNPGYSFVGWYSDADCKDTPISTNASFVPTKDANALWVDGATYYAKFVEDEVVISYKVIGPDGCGTVALNDNSATGTSVSETIGEANGDAQGATANKNPGYEFKGWFTNEACNGDPVSTAISYDPQKVDGLNVSATYYAKFEEIKVTINYVVKDGVGGTVTPGSEELGAATGVAQGSTAAAKDGYTFAGWYSDEACTQKVSDDLAFVPEKVNGLNVAATYYAKFTENSATINYVAVGPNGATNFGSVSPESESVLVVTGKANGSTATANAPTFRFVGWYSDADCKGTPISTNANFVPTKAYGTLWKDSATFYAKFEYNLTSLTIEKLTGYINGDAFVNKSYDDIDQNQTFIFTVSGKDAKGNDMSIDVTVHVSDGSGSTTIDGITVGQSYTITEKTDWSWRYDHHDTEAQNCTDVSKNGSSITFIAGLNGVVTFKDARTDEQWLDGDSWCDNRFGPSAAN